MQHVSSPQHLQPVRAPVADGAVLGAEGALEAAGGAGAQVRASARAAQPVTMLRVAFIVQVTRVRARRPAHA